MEAINTPGDLHPVLLDGVAVQMTFRLQLL